MSPGNTQQDLVADFVLDAMALLEQGLESRDNQES